MASFIRKLSYTVLFPVGTRSNALITLASVVNSGTGSNLVDKNFLRHGWKESIAQIKSQNFELRIAKSLTSRTFCIYLYSFATYACAPGFGLSIILLFKNGSERRLSPDAYATKSFFGT